MEKLNLENKLNIFDASELMGDKEVYISSLEAAKRTGKQHYHVLEKVRWLFEQENWEFELNNHFRKSEYEDTTGKLRPYYQMTRLGYLTYVLSLNSRVDLKLKDILSLVNKNNAKGEEEMKNEKGLNQEVVESTDINITYPDENKLNYIIVDGEEHLYGYAEVEETLIKAVEIDDNTYFKWNDISKYIRKKINKKLNPTMQFKRVKLGGIIVGIDTETVNKNVSKWVDAQGLTEMLRYLINKHKDKLLPLSKELGLQDNTVITIQEAKRKIELIKRGGTFYISTLDIAAELEKNHKDVLKKVRWLNDRENLVAAINYSTIQAEYEDTTGVLRPYYLLSKDMFTLLMFNYEGYLEFKIKYINKFNEMEEELKQLHTGEIQKEDIKSVDKETSPYKEITRKYANYTVTEIAQEIDVESRDLNLFLCRKGIQYKYYDRYYLCDGYDNNFVKSANYWDKDSYQKKEFMVWTEEGKDFIINYIEKCYEEKQNSLKENNL